MDSILFKRICVTYFSKTVLFLALTLIFTAEKSLAKRAMLILRNQTYMSQVHDEIQQLRSHRNTHLTLNKTLGAPLRLEQIEKVLPKLNALIIDYRNDSELEGLRENSKIYTVEKEVKHPLPFPISQFYRKALPQTLNSQFAFSLTPWGISAIKAQEAWNLTQGGSSARVLVLDTGVDKDHPSIRGNLEQGKDFVGDNQDGYPYKDSVGHGTHVSGTIAGVLDSTGFSGVAPRAHLLMGRVCSEDGCSNFAIAEGVNWGIEQKVDVINMSLGGSWSTITEQIAIESAIKAGITIVAATGNDGVGSVSYPAALPNCIAVGALDVNNKRAEFSQYGPELAIMAPGVEVDSSVPLGKGRSPVVQVKIGESSIESVKSTVLQGSRMISRPETYEMVYAGLGSEEEFKNVDVAGKIALVERGELKFSEKVKNAIQAQAKGVIIYNNADGLLNGSLSDDGSEVPVGVFMIEKVVGEKIKQSLIQGVQATAAYQVQVTNYGSNNGTSMATPHVSGVVALMKSVNKNLTPQQVKEILQRTASVIPNTNTNEYGAGLVNAEQAVIEAKNYLNP